MKLYYIEYTVGEDVRHEQIYARSFGQAKIRLRQKAKGITSIQQVSAGYLKKHESREKGLEGVPGVPVKTNA